MSLRPSDTIVFGSAKWDCPLVQLERGVANSAKTKSTHKHWCIQSIKSGNGFSREGFSGVKATNGYSTHTNTLAISHKHQPSATNTSLQLPLKPPRPTPAFFKWKIETEIIVSPQWQWLTLEKAMCQMKMVAFCAMVAKTTSLTGLELDVHIISTQKHKMQLWWRRNETHKGW